MRALFASKIVALTGLLLSCSAPTTDFRAEQQTYPRVRAAYATHAARLDSALTCRGLQRGRLQVLFTVFKQEKKLEIWAKNAGTRAYERLLTLPICRRSGGFGPKCARGDEQMPEGFYIINRFNPASAYHLSLGTDYPNAADRRRAPAGADLGGDIFLHGACVTIGCVPLTDAGIEQAYLYAVEARASGQAQIPVYFFPARLTAAKLASLSACYAADNPALAAFWANLKQGYDRFSATHEELRVRADAAGAYQFQ